MTWTKLGDEFADETMDLSSDAFRLHVEALIWSNRKLADLLVPTRMLPRLSALDDPGPAIDELVHTGWWQQVDDDTFWIGCRFAEWQRDRVQVEHRRNQLALAQRRKRRHELDDHSLCLPSRCKSASTVDSTVESYDDPGRLRLRGGKGRSRSEGVQEVPVLEGSEHPDSSLDLTPAPPVTQVVTRNMPRNGDSPPCSVCGRTSGFSLIDGRCRRCR